MRGAVRAVRQPCIVFHVVRNERLPAANSQSYRSLSLGKIGPDGAAYLRNETAGGPGRRGRNHLLAFAVDHADPGKTKPALLRRDPACLLEQLFPVADANDQRIDG